LWLRFAGVTKEQFSNILSVINGGEQSTADWTKRNSGTDNKPVWSPVWGYCENIKDGRGITMGIAGVTTKDGSAKDYIESVAKYGAPSFDEMKKNQDNPKNVCKWWEKNSAQAFLIQANINSYQKLYLQMVMDYKKANQKNIRDAIQIALMLDAAMNAGEDQENCKGKKAYGLKQLMNAVKNENTTEGWVSKWITTRVNNFTCNSGKPDGRMLPYKTMLANKKFDMIFKACDYTWCDTGSTPKLRVKGACGGCP
jgi:hypothetical protein